MKKKILIVDDSLSIRKISEHVLESAGYEVFTAKDGIEALDLCTSVTIDLIISDINMENMDGFELLKILKSQDATAGIPVIILTTEGEDRDRDTALSLGANAYLVKPFKASELIEQSNRLLGSDPHSME